MPDIDISDPDYLYYIDLPAIKKQLQNEAGLSRLRCSEAIKNSATE